jgi:HlyD family secretion protein
VPSSTSQRVTRIGGTVQALRSYTVQAPQIQGQSGRLTLTRLVPNGTRVQQDDALAEFDPTQQTDAAREFKAKVEDLVHQIEQKKASNRAEAAKRSAETREAEAELSKASIQLRKGPILSDIERLQNETKAATARLRVESLKKSHAARDAAEAASLRILELQRDRQQVGLDRAQSNLERLVIRAPIAGMVALQNIWRSGSMGPAQEGDQLYPGQGLLRIFDPTSMVVEAQINQADGAHLVKGTKAKIRLDAYPGTEFPAVLEFSSPVATAALDSPIRFFPARFLLTEVDPRILPDLSAAIDIQEGM